MISDWFHDRLKRSGHNNLDEVGCRVLSGSVTADMVIERLRRFHEFRHVVRITINEQSVSRSEDVMTAIEDEEIEFGPWTSFRDECTIYFVFLFMRSAMRFKLLLPD